VAWDAVNPAASHGRQIPVFNRRGIIVPGGNTILLLKAESR
jgi:hypothetical protein